VCTSPRGGGEEYENTSYEFSYVVTLSLWIVGTIERNLGLLDTGASKSIFGDPSLLHDIKSVSPVTFHGISGSETPVVANRSGRFGDFGQVMFDDSARANVLSMSELEDQGFVAEYDSTKKMFSLTSPTGAIHLFKRHKGMYALANLAEPSPISRKEIALVTVAERRAEFTTRELLEIDAAKKFQDALGSPSIESAIDVVKSNTLLNNPVTVEHLKRAEYVNGKNLGLIKGKTTAPAQSAPLHRTEYPPGRTAQEAHCDLFFLNGNAFLITVTHPLGVTIITHLGVGKGARTTANIRKALLAHTNGLKTRGFTVAQVISDGEGGIIKAFEEESPFDFPLNPRGTKMHAPWVERKIRTVKEICRAVYNTLGFRLPNSFLQSEHPTQQVRTPRVPKIAFLWIQAGLCQRNERYFRRICASIQPILRKRNHGASDRCMHPPVPSRKYGRVLQDVLYPKHEGYLTR
jgi:hypothetical protein